MRYSLGRYAYGVAAIGFGICALIWHDIGNWLQLKTLAGVEHGGIVPYAVGIVEIVGGAALLVRATQRAGAAILGTLYALFALFALPFVIEHPRVYNGYGNFFEIFSFVAGAAILYVYAGRSPSRMQRVARCAYYAVGVCVLSFGLEQLFYLSPTAQLVPKWIPPGQIFWAVATTIAFVLAAIALLTGFQARLAAMLTAAMLGGFGLFVWVPILFADPHTFGNWTESFETLGIAASVWLVAETRRPAAH